MSNPHSTLESAISFRIVIQKKIQKRETALKPQTHQQQSLFRVSSVITLEESGETGKQKHGSFSPTLHSTRSTAFKICSDLLHKNHGGVWGHSFNCRVLKGSWSTSSNQVLWCRPAILALWRWTKGSEVQGHTGPATEFKTRLGYIGP